MPGVTTNPPGTRKGHAGSAYTTGAVSLNGTSNIDIVALTTRS